jgi:hypothetical protein
MTPTELNQADTTRIEALMAEGHTHHCACRIVFGDGECTCMQRGDENRRLDRIIEMAKGIQCP